MSFEFSVKLGKNFFGGNQIALAFIDLPASPEDLFLPLRADRECFVGIEVLQPGDLFLVPQFYRDFII